MTTYYIDPDWGGTESGTLAEPYSSWTTPTIANGNTYLQKRGTVENILTRQTIGTDVNGVVFGAYYNSDGSDDISQPKPIIQSYKNDLVTGDWVQLDSVSYPNVWVSSGKWTQEYWNSPYLIGWNTLDNHGVQVPFQQVLATPTVAISLVTTGATTTIDTASAHGITDGDAVYISGSDTTPSIDGPRIATVIDTDTLTIPITTTDAGTSAGVVNVYDWSAAPAADGEWDFYEGGTSNYPKMYMYATSNPASYYSNIYYQNGQETFFLAYRLIDLEIRDLHYQYYASDLSVSVGSGSSTEGSLWYHDCEMSHAGAAGIKHLINTGGTWWSNGTVIERCYIHHCRIAGISGFDYTKNLHIRNNIMHDLCQSASTGGIYSGRSFNTEGDEIHIYNNDISNVYMGNYWIWDGGAIETDSDGMNTFIYNNYLHDTEQAWHDNSGKKNTFFNNIIEHCAVGVLTSDASNVDEYDVYILNNTLIDCGNLDYTGATGGGANNIIRLNCSATDSTAQATVLNNILIGSSNTVSDGIVKAADFVSAGTLTEANNCFYNMNRQMVAGTTDDSANIDNSDIIGDPELNSKAAPHINSNVVGAGTTPYKVFDAYNIPKTGNGYHIGAVWPDINTSKTRREIE